VEKRREQLGHWRRRRIVAPSSDVRESTTRESGWRQNGQCIRSGYRHDPRSARGILRRGQLELLTGGDPARGQMVEAADLVDELGGVRGGVVSEGVARLDRDHGGLGGLGAGEGGGEVEREEGDRGDREAEQEGDAREEAPAAAGRLESNTRSSDGLAGLLVLPRGGKDRGGRGTHLLTLALSHLCVNGVYRAR